MNPNEKRIATIEIRARRADPGPWRWETEGAVFQASVRLFHAGPAINRLHEFNAEFVAEAREDIPWLVARVKQLEGALRELKESGDYVEAKIIDIVLAADPLEWD